MKILLAVDGSDYTRKMLDYVCGNRALFDASHSYVLFHAQAPLPPHARSALGATAVQKYHEEEALKVLEPALAHLKECGLQATSSWKVGPAGDCIAAVSQDGGYDMVIMGSHGHKSLAQLVIGSLDMALAAAVLWVLLPPTGMSFAAFLGLFMIAQMIGVGSQVPGGLGVFEALMMHVMEDRAGEPQVLSALLVFRLVYFIIPLAIAAAWLGWHELQVRRKAKSVS